MVRMSENKDIALKVLAVFAISRLVILIVYWIYLSVFHDRSGFQTIFGRWDALYYVDMVRNGYELPLGHNAQVNLAFFPLYPLVCRGLALITLWKIPVFYTCLIVSNTAVYFAAFFAVKLIRMMGLYRFEDKTFFQGLFKDGLLIAWLILMGPFTVYFATAYTESLFIFLVVLCFYFIKSKNFLAAGAVAGLASGTRSLGAVLFIPMIVEMVVTLRKERAGAGTGEIIKGIFSRPQWLLGLILVPSGTFAYMGYLKWFCGDAWAFTHVQTAWRSEKMLPVAGVLFKACTGQLEARYTVMGWICIAAIALFIYMWKKEFKTMASYGLATLLIALSSHVMSTPRFISGCFVAWVGIYYVLVRMKKAPRIIGILGLGAGGIMTIALWMAWSKAVM